MSVFTTPINLSGDNKQAKFPWVASIGNNVYVAWTEESNGVWFRSSPNNGLTWSPPIGSKALALGTNAGVSSYPVMAVNGSYVYVIWQQTVNSISQVYIAISNNYGVSFSPSVALTPSTVQSDVPFIAAAGNNVYVIVHETSGSTQSIWVYSSNNNGATWLAPPLQLNAGSSQGTEPQIAAWGNDAYATWDRNGAWFSGTTNGGATWSKAVNLNQPGNKGDVREPWIAASGPNVYVTWNDNSGYGSTPANTNYHAYISISTNYGLTWSKDKINLFPNGTGDWEVEDAAVGNTVYISMRDHTLPYSPQGNVFYMYSNNAGVTWTPAIGSTSVPMSVSNNPQITGWTNGVGISGTTVAMAYESNCLVGSGENLTDTGNGDCGVYVSYSNNGGQTFYAQSPVTTDGTAGPITDDTSVTFSVSGSNVYVVWQDSAASNFQVYFSETGGQLYYPAQFSALPVRGAVGTSVDVSGSNFKPSTVITVKFDGTTVATPTSLSTGSFSTQVTIPTSVAGSHTFSATDGVNTLSQNFNVLSSVSISPSKGQSGNTITISGNGYAASSQVSVTFGGSATTTTPSTITTDSLGDFGPASFQVPNMAPNTYTVTATDSTGNTSSANFNMSPPKITLSPVKGATGTSVTISGAGFASDSAVALTYDSSSINPSVPTNSSGGFSYVFTVQDSVAGAHTITATDSSLDTATGTFTVVPSFSYTPVKGATGKLATMTGTGFAADSLVTVTYDGGALNTATTDSLGDYAVTFTIPPSTAGKHSVVATDASGNSASGQYTVVPNIALSPKPARVGSIVTITGNGFAASSTITVTFGGSSITTSPAPITSDATGSFTATFVVPTGASGSVTVSASDGTNSATATITIK